jgi:hypothetical protein
VVQNTVELVMHNDILTLSKMSYLMVEIPLLTITGKLFSNQAFFCPISHQWAMTVAPNRWIEFQQHVHQIKGQFLQA